MRMVLRDSSRRGAVFSALVGLIWYGFWGFIGFGAFAYTSDPNARAQIERWLPAGLLLLLFWWQLAPVMTGNFGATLDIRKLLVYPVPRGKLYTVEVLLRITACGENLLVVAGIGLGLAANPAFGNQPRIVAGLMLFVLFNVLLNAGLRSLLERLFSYRRLREWMIILVVLLTALPRLLWAKHVGAQALEAIAEAVSGRWWPWTAAAHLAIGTDPAPALGLMAAFCCAAWLFSRQQFERNLRHDPQAAGATPAHARYAGWADQLFRLPSYLLPDPLATIVEKELRSLSRTPRFRTVFVMGFTFGLLVWLPMILRGPGLHSGLQQHFLAVVSLYALILLGQISYWNAFGFDRTAAQYWFSAPVPLGFVLGGKNLAAALFILLEVLAVTAACLALRLAISPARILEAYLVAPVASLYMISLGNLSSVHFPRPMNPEQVSRGGAGGRAQGLVFLVYPAALAPVLLAYLARYAFGSEAVFYLVLAFAAVLGAVVYRVSMESAVSAALRRREQIVAALATGQGPAATE